MLYTKSIKRNTDFRRMYYKAKFKVGFLTVTYVRKQRSDFAYFGVTVSKKVGNAVVRNRVKRIIVAAYQKLEKIEDFRGYSFVVVARKNCVAAGMWNVFEELKKNLNFLKLSELNKNMSYKNRTK